PFVFAMLSKLAGPTPDVRAALIRGRLLFAFFGAVVGGVMALLLWRVSRRFDVLAVAVLLSMSGPDVWLRTFADVRGEPFALALWLAGAASVVLARRAAIRGCGIGLVALACLVNPKWPAASTVIGIVFVAGLLRDDGRRRVAALAAAAISTAAA